MRAMVLAAGLGTRLRPLTLSRPKALVPVMGLPMLDYWIRRLADAGFEAVVVNSHHLHEKMAAAIEGGSWPIPVEIRVEPVLLGTGGGIRNALDFFGKDPFLVINSDIICGADLKALYELHSTASDSVTMLLHDCPQFNNVSVSPNGEIVGFGREEGTGSHRQADVRQLAFTGAQVIHPTVLRDLSAGVPGDILSVYRRLIREGRPPKAVVDTGLLWKEMGSIEAYRKVHEELSILTESILSPFKTGRAVQIHPEAWVSSGACVRGVVVIGRGSRVAEGADLQDTILWDRVRIEKGARLRGCIVADEVVVRGDHENEVLVGDVS